jgi:hypothetical protein
MDGLFLEALLLGNVFTGQLPINVHTRHNMYDAHPFASAILQTRIVLHSHANAILIE